MSIESIVAQMKAEAESMGHRRASAWIESGRGAHDIEVRRGGPVSADPERRSRIREAEEARATALTNARDLKEREAMKLMQDRDPCGRCGTRKDRHDEFGCKRWREG